jgi:hypothetical protein
MSLTIPTDIAAQIKAALIAVVPDGTTVYADGIADDPSPDGDELQLPAVSIVVSECIPQQYRSVLRAFPVSIDVATWYQEDNAQEELYTIASAVSQWLALPSLTLRLSHWDALTIDSAPTRENDGRVQYMRWFADCKTRTL